MSYVLDRFSDWDAADWLVGGLVAIFLAVSLMGVLATTMHLVSDGRVTRCYVRYQAMHGSPGTYVVKGDIDWNDDVVLAHAPTGQQAVELMPTVCPVR